uniref:PAN2 UCH domain-containing protein n=2 Tax=Dunaliella tertiolecta TaxID=3047 RepID=A0A7S3VSI1_DUNTE
MYSPYHSVSCDWGELSVNAVDLEYAEAVTSVQFDGLQEVVWAGTSMGRVNTFLTPLLEPYACWPAHTGSVTGILPLPGTDCALTVGREAATLSTNGGLRKAGIRPGLQADNTQASFGGCCFEPSTRGQSIPQAAIMGLLSGGLMHWDLNTSKVLVMNKECLGTEGVSHLCGPVGRGGSLLAAGLRTGRLVLLDCRTPRSLKLEPGAGAVGVAAHTGGFTAMDARGDYVACCGYSMRGSHAQPDAYMKVFDMRNLGGSTLKPMLTLPFPNISGAPTSLSFHPKMHSLLLVGSGRGGLNMVDIAKGTSISTHQVTYDGSGLGSVCIAPTGEAWLLGDATSCVRLWSESDTPRCHTVPNYTEVPPAYAMPSVEIGEEDSFASVPQYPLASMELGASYLSDLAPNATMSIGQPPRIIDPSILKQVRQVDFIGHHPNPKYVRGAPYGQATAAVAQLRNMRVPMVSIKPPPVAANKSEKKKRTGPILPRKFKRVEIRVQAGLKFEEFNFASFNCTRFAGLENDLPNSYANALLQVLYFTPGLRTALLHHVPEPDSEFCLACELGLLFRCMAASHGKPCQAANLLRALRQIREAAALGLLDSSSSLARVGAHGGQAHEETLARRWALGRRVAALARFLMDHCHKEASPKAHPECSSHNRSGIVPQPVPTNAALGPLLERLAALPHTVRLKCLGGSREEKTREDRVFQVDLQYPMEREKAARLAADAANLGFNKIPEAAAAVLRSAAPTRSHAAPAASIEPNSEAEGRRQQQQQHQQQQQLPLGEGQESVPQQPQQQQGQPQLQDQEQKQQQNGKEGQQGQGSAASTAAAAAAAAAVRR